MSAAQAAPRHQVKAPLGCHGRPYERYIWNTLNDIGRMRLYHFLVSAVRNTAWGATLQVTPRSLYIYTQIPETWDAVG